MEWEEVETGCWFIRNDNPLKQGLKRNKMLNNQYKQTQIRNDNPLKQGLKPNTDRSFFANSVNKK